MNKLKKCFGNKRIIGLAGNKNSGKTNNLIHLIQDFQKSHKTVKIFAYGMEAKIIRYLKIQEISSLEHLIKKKDCLIIIDEFQMLKLNHRKYKDTLNEFIDFVYHNNVYVILSTPNIREFNSIIGGVIEKWLLKDIRIDQCINGSQLKQIVEAYKGRYKTLGSISIDKDRLLVINDTQETVIYCPYIVEADTKLNQPTIF